MDLIRKKFNHKKQILSLLAVTLITGISFPVNINNLCNTIISVFLYNFILVVHFCKMCRNVI